MEKTIVEQSVTPYVLLSQAIEKGVDTSTLEKMMDLQERYENNEARKAYVQAMTAFKSNPPQIEKDKNVKYNTSKGMTQYKHASLFNVTTKINMALSEHGLSAAWKESQTDNKITVICTITHIGGYSESTSLQAEADNSGGKNSIQAIGSTVSYLQRYTLLSLTGLATEEMDDDGKGAAEYITAEEAKKLQTDLMSINGDGVKFLAYIGCKSFDTIPMKDLKKAQQVIAVKKQNLKKEKI